MERDTNIISLLIKDIQYLSKFFFRVPVCRLLILVFEALLLLKSLVGLLH
jgi:hypothetical protein